MRIVCRLPLHAIYGSFGAGSIKSDVVRIDVTDGIERIFPSNDGRSLTFHRIDQSSTWQMTYHPLTGNVWSWTSIFPWAVNYETIRIVVTRDQFGQALVGRSQLGKILWTLPLMPAIGFSVSAAGGDILLVRCSTSQTGRDRNNPSLIREMIDKEEYLAINVKTGKVKWRKKYKGIGQVLWNDSNSLLTSRKGLPANGSHTCITNLARLQNLIELRSFKTSRVIWRSSVAATPFELHSIHRFTNQTMSFAFKAKDSSVTTSSDAAKMITVLIPNEYFDRKPHFGQGVIVESRPE